MVLEYLGNLVEGILHLLGRVRGHERETDERVLGCYGRRHHGVDKDTLVEKVARDGKGLEVIADKERDNRGRSIADFETTAAEAFEGDIGELPQVHLQLGLLNHDVDSLEGGGGRGRGDAGGEDIRARMVAQVIGNLLVRSDKAAQRGKRLRESARR